MTPKLNITRLDLWKVFLPPESVAVAEAAPAVVDFIVPVPISDVSCIAKDVLDALLVVADVPPAPVEPAEVVVVRCTLVSVSVGREDSETRDSLSELCVLVCQLPEGVVVNVGSGTPFTLFSAQTTSKPEVSADPSVKHMK